MSPGNVLRQKKLATLIVKNQSGVLRPGSPRYLLTCFPGVMGHCLEEKAMAQLVDEGLTICSERVAVNRQ